MLDLQENDVTRCCGSAAAEAGRRYHRQARVVGFSREGDTVRSAVKGSQPAPYRQVIRLTQRRAGVDVAGTCNCPVGLNCKHVAAALFHAVTVAAADKARAARSPEPWSVRIARLRPIVDAIRDLGRRLTAAGGIPPVAVPPAFLATLRSC